MKPIFAFLIILMTTLASAEAQNSAQTPGKLLRHVVLLKFKTTSSAADVKNVEDAFRAVPTKIKTVRGFEWGKNNSPENLNQEFTHCFFVTFDSEKDRDAYLLYIPVKLTTPFRGKLTT